jgi:hypothetical protein
VTEIANFWEPFCDPLVETVEAAVSPTLLGAVECRAACVGEVAQFTMLPGDSVDAQQAKGVAVARAALAMNKLESRWKAKGIAAPTINLQGCVRRKRLPVFAYTSDYC